MTLLCVVFQKFSLGAVAEAQGCAVQEVDVQNLMVLGIIGSCKEP